MGLVSSDHKFSCICFSVRKHRPYLGRGEIKLPPVMANALKVTKAPAAPVATTVTVASKAPKAPAKSEVNGERDAAAKSKEGGKLEAMFRDLVTNVTTTLHSGEPNGDKIYLTWGKALESIVKLGKSEASENIDTVVKAEIPAEAKAPTAEKKVAVTTPRAKPAHVPPAATSGRAPAAPRIVTKSPVVEPTAPPAMPSAAPGRIRRNMKRHSHDFSNRSI